MSSEVNVVGAFTVLATPVRFVGKTDDYPDVLYGTGTWKIGQTKPVVSTVALKMLAHPEYVRDGEDFMAGAAPIGEVPNKQEPDGSRDQDLRDAIARMDRGALQSLIGIHYGMTVDKRLGVASLRQQATRLVDQFGVS